MAWAAKVSGGAVTDVALLEGDPPSGWIASATKIGIGWYYDGTTFSPPPAITAPTDAEVIQQIADSLTDGSDRDKALAMVLADLVARAFNLSVSEARQMVRDRFVTHLQTLRGL